MVQGKLRSGPSLWGRMDRRVKPACGILTVLESTGFSRMRLLLVFCAFKDARHHGDADQSLDRDRPDRGIIVAHAICAARPPAARGMRGAVCDLRLHAAGQTAFVPSG